MGMSKSWLGLGLYLLILHFILPSIFAHHPVVHGISFSPATLVLTEWTSGKVTYNLTLNLDEWAPMSSARLVEYQHPDTEIARILNYSYTSETSSEAWNTISGEFIVEAATMGRTKIELITGVNRTALASYPVLVIRAPRVIDTVFNRMSTIIVIANNFIFGSTFDWHIARQILKRPVAPIIGFVCQCGFMPMVSNTRALTHLPLYKTADDIFKCIFVN